MPTTETRLNWIQAAPGPGDLHFAGCGLYDFEIRATAGMKYQLRMWLLRPEDSPLLWWENDFYGLEEAEAKAERLADQNESGRIRGVSHSEGNSPEGFQGSTNRAYRRWNPS